MDFGFDKTKLLQYKAVALKHLSDPVKLRLAVVSALTLLSIICAYVPLSGQITKRTAMLGVEKRRLDAIKEVEALRREAESYRGRISPNADTNEWVQYILGGLRKVNLKLRDMESKQPRKIGPYRAVTLTVEVAGPYSKIKAFMEWLEQSDRLLRVHSIRIEKQPKNLLMKIVLLGLVHKNAKPAR